MAKVYVEKQQDWIGSISISDLKDTDIQRILLFYLFHTPIEKLSTMSRTIKGYYCWGEKAWKAPLSLNKQLDQAISDEKFLFSADTYDQMEEKLIEANLYSDFPNNLNEEKICVYDKQDNQYESMFYHLRNSFAHGRFKVCNINGNTLFIFEDINEKKGKNIVSARMILKKSTLIKWIDLIEDGPKEYKK